MNNNIIIIGAGASGLFASIFLAKKNYNVLILEKNTKAGRKILASGNGKCNITNKNLSLENFHSSNKNFLKYSIEQMPYDKIKQIFDDMGLLLSIGEGTRMYPMSMQASSVSEILYNEALSLGVKFEFSSYVTNVKSKKNIFDIFVENKKYTSKYLVIASGSDAMKKLGSCNKAYDFAKSFGHKIIKPYASLVQLQSKDKSIFSLSGVKTKSNVTLLINNKKINTLFGDILFTKYGLSGNTILDLSRDASKALVEKKTVKIHIDIMYNISKDELITLLLNRQKLLKNKDIIFLLESMINTKLIKYIYKILNIQYKFIKEFSKNDLTNIAYILKNINVDISSTNGNENAEVNAGGISVSDVNSKTMQSNKKKNLFFCGEVLDVDGSCGGYNFHWAWSSAYTLAKSFNYNKE